MIETNVTGVRTTNIKMIDAIFDELETMTRANPNH